MLVIVSVFVKDREGPLLNQLFNKTNSSVSKFFCVHGLEIFTEITKQFMVGDIVLVYIPFKCTVCGAVLRTLSYVSGMHSVWCL